MTCSAKYWLDLYVKEHVLVDIKLLIIITQCRIFDLNLKLKRWNKKLMRLKLMGRSMF